MPLISDATLHVGSSTVDAVYHGATQVWPTAGPATITHGWQIAADTSLVGPAAGGFTSLVTITGDHTMSVDGATLSGKNITGGLIIEADNVTVEGCRIGQGIWHDTEFRGSTVRYCNVGPDGTYTTNFSAGMTINPGCRSLSYSDVHNGPDILRLVGSGGFTPLVEYCWLHEPEDPSDVDPHADIIQLSGGTGLATIRGCFMDASIMYYNTTSANPPPDRRISTLPNTAVIFESNWSDGTITLQNNLLIGGIYTAALNDATAARNGFYVVEGNWFGSGTVTTDAGGTEPFPRFGPVNIGGSELSQFTWSDNHTAELSGGVWVTTGAIASP